MNICSTKIGKIRILDKVRMIKRDTKYIENIVPE